MTKFLGTMLLALALSASGCTQVDLSKALTVTDVFAGYYHFGVVEGQNKMVPSFSFRLSNAGEDPLNRVQLMVSFWQVGDTGMELDSKQIEGIGAAELAPGASTEPILVRSEKGYTLPLEQAREEMFQHSLFQDSKVKVFARYGARLVPLGEFPVDRRIIPQSGTLSTVP
jgi:hypothetical protein